MKTKAEIATSDSPEGAAAPVGPATFWECKRCKWNIRSAGLMDWLFVAERHAHDNALRLRTCCGKVTPVFSHDSRTGSGVSLSKASSPLSKGAEEKEKESSANAGDVTPQGLPAEETGYDEREPMEECQAQWNRMSETFRGQIDKPSFELGWQLAWCQALKSQLGSAVRAEQTRAATQEPKELLPPPVPDKKEQC